MVVSPSTGTDVAMKACKPVFLKPSYFSFSHPFYSILL
jgi:hypothetical protein